MDDLILFTFNNGCDRITVASGDIEGAREQAFRQCEQLSMPLTYIGITAWTTEMLAMMMQDQTIH